MRRTKGEDRSLVIHAVAFQEGDLWIVQGIEYDIVAHASDPAKLPLAFMRALVENASIAEHLGRAPFEGIEPAPAMFREMFEAARTELREVEPQMPMPALPIAEMAIRLAEARG